MGEERIIYEVDDTQLDAAIAKLQHAVSLSTATLGSPSVAKGVMAVRPGVTILQQDLTQIAQNEALLDQMPTINREMRLILGQVPGLRGAINAYYRLRRLARGIDIGGFQLYITIIATAILMLKFILNQVQEARRREKEYERLIREYKQMTHAEFVAIRNKEKMALRRGP